MEKLNNETVDRALAFILGEVCEDHRIAIARHIQDQNVHFYQLINLINNIFNLNKNIADDLFVNEKCRNIAGEVIAKTIKEHLLYGHDLRERFVQIKEWYNEFGIQWPDSSLLCWPFVNEDE